MKFNLRMLAIGLIGTMAFTSCAVRQDRPRRDRHPRKVIVERNDSRNDNHNNNRY